MSVDILIEFKNPEKKTLIILIGAQGTYHDIWATLAKQLQLEWLPECLFGMDIPVEKLPTIIDEFRQVRALLIRNPPKSTWWNPIDVAGLIERADFILEKLTELDPNEIAEIFIG